MRPEMGTHVQFKRKKPPTTYRYDSSLSPSLEWGGQNPARETGEAQLAVISDQLSVIRSALAALLEKTTDPGLRKLITDSLIIDHLPKVQEALRTLKSLSKPFLNWSGKAERLSFDVPTLPLFIHERLSTKAIIETLKGHKTDKQEDFFRELWGDPQHSVTDQILRAYEYRDDWVNRMMLGDSLVCMNSLLRYESLGGQVQMIYLDPPYGVKFGSNFQPFVRKRDVAHNDDEDMTREPEMVQAYRDTWELGLHSYLTYLRDRLLLARELLHPSGSIFVQISDENLHHVREVMDEVFGAENFCRVIAFKKTTGQSSDLIPSVFDYLLWYAKDRQSLKTRPVLIRRPDESTEGAYTWVEFPDKSQGRITAKDFENLEALAGARRFMTASLMSSGASETGSQPFEFEGQTYQCCPGTHWKTHRDGLKRLTEVGRLIAVGKTLAYKRYADDYPFVSLNNVWDDTLQSTFAIETIYVVQTATKVVQRCLLMTTDPGDLVLDPTCGSGTTAYVAEQWGRRWIIMDTSRVPLALARQRLLTATFPFYEINSGSAGVSPAVSGVPPETSPPARLSAPVSSARTPKTATETVALPNNPAAGFVYRRKQNSKGEETGGIVPHITLKSMANNEPPAEEVLVDRPEVVGSIVRVTGPFAFEATIPTPVDWEGSAGVSPAVSGVSPETSDGDKQPEGKSSARTPKTGRETRALPGEDYGSFVDLMITCKRRRT
jgi:adenine-specific DNA-methyltransferase